MGWICLGLTQCYDTYKGFGLTSASIRPSWNVGRCSSLLLAEESVCEVRYLCAVHSTPEFSAGLVHSDANSVSLI